VIRDREKPTVFPITDHRSPVTTTPRTTDATNRRSQRQPQPQWKNQLKTCVAKNAFSDAMRLATDLAPGDRSCLALASPDMSKNPPLPSRPKKSVGQHGPLGHLGRLAKKGPPPNRNVAGTLRVPSRRTRMATKPTMTQCAIRPLTEASSAGSPRRTESAYCRAR
jgi:hypothetical protein